jgi:predicted nucleic acid-binding Zn ribbon protein
VLRADSTAWATQVRLLAEDLKARIDSQLGAGVVKTITVNGPVAPSWKKGPRSVRGGRGPRDTYG